ncbi:MAG: WbqC family protein [Woeseiaceae bacterium]
MKLAIMQPYFFPYLGYFRLAAAVDKFVFYDDVNFIKNGWINRNRLRLSGEVRYFTAPLAGASSSRKILEVEVQPGPVWRRKMLDSIRQSYAKAPFTGDVIDLVSSVIDNPSTNVADLAKRTVVSVASYLALATEFVWTSSKYGNSELSGERRVIDICKHEGATQYFNLAGGKNLYSPSAFELVGIDLCFVDSPDQQYWQGGRSFEPGLSILDALFWNERAVVSNMLHEHVNL